MIRKHRIGWVLLAPILLFAYNNCGGGFYALDADSLASMSSAMEDDNSAYRLSCIPKTSAKLTTTEEVTTEDSGPQFEKKWANDLHNPSQTSTRTGLNKAQSEISESLANLIFEVDRDCVIQNGAQSALTALLKEKIRSSPTSQTVLRLSSDEQARMTMADIENSVNLDPCLLKVDRNATFKLMAAPNDPRFAEQVHLRSINYENVFSRIYNTANGINREVRIAILDSGLDIAHPDLAANILRDAQGSVIGYNPLNNSTDVSDSGYHGTHVAGLAAAVANNNLGVAGLLGIRGRIMPVKVSSDGTSVNLDAVINGIIWATDNGAEVINMSFTSDKAADDRPSLRQAIQYALKKGVVFVVAAGNSSTLITADKHFYPAKYSALYKGFITVGSYDAASATSERSGFSNYGPDFVKIMAPGQNGSDGILSTIPSKLTSSGLASKANGTPIHGTSMASPMVAGAAAMAIGLAKSRGYKAPPEQIEELLMRGSLKLSSLSSSAKNGNKLDLKTLVDVIDTDTGLNSNGNVDRSNARGIIMIGQQPRDQKTLYGTAFELSVETTGASSILLDYTWKRNGQVLAGERSNKISVPAAQAKDAGLYEVTIRAGSESYTSQKIKVELAPGYCN